MWQINKTNKQTNGNPYKAKQNGCGKCPEMVICTDSSKLNHILNNIVMHQNVNDCFATGANGMTLDCHYRFFETPDSYTNHESGKFQSFYVQTV